MANTYVDIEDKYDLKTATENVTVSALIGNAQPGAYSIFLDSELKSQNSPALLGSANLIKGKTIIISCIVQDTRTETNWTSLTVGITEGNSDQKSYGPYSKQVSKDLDTVTYTIKISLL